MHRTGSVYYTLTYIHKTENFLSYLINFMPFAPRIKIKWNTFYVCYHRTIHILSKANSNLIYIESHTTIREREREEL